MKYKIISNTPDNVRTITVSKIKEFPNTAIIAYRVIGNVPDLGILVRKPFGNDDEYWGFRYFRHILFGNHVTLMFPSNCKIGAIEKALASGKDLTFYQSINDIFTGE